MLPTQWAVWKRWVVFSAPYLRQISQSANGKLDNTTRTERLRVFWTSRFGYSGWRLNPTQPNRRETEPRLPTPMIRPDLSKWGQTLDDLRRLSTESSHSRTRQRFLALFMVASGHYNATQWASKIDLQDETVMRWIHLYNQSGPQALIYQRTGGRPPFLPPSRPPKPSTPLRTPLRKTTACLVTLGPPKS